MGIELPSTVRDLLEGPNVAHLATVRPDGSPASCPVWIGTMGNDLLVGTGRNTAKVRNAQHNPHVALSVVHRDNPYEEVLLRGTVVEVRDDLDCTYMDPISVAYTGKPFPFREGPRVVLVIEPTWFDHRVLPFEPAAE